MKIWKKHVNTFILLLLLILPLAVWGYAFELSYFSSLDIPLPNELSVTHFVYQSLVPVAFMLVTIGIYQAVKTVFLPIQISKDNSGAFAKIVADAELDGFRKITNAVRFMVLLAIFYLAAIYLDWQLPRTHEGDNRDVGIMWWFMIYVVSPALLLAIAITPKNSKISFYVVAILALSCLYAAGGIYEARAPINDPNVLRDDNIVTIERRGDDVNVEIHEVPLITIWRNLKEF